MLAGVPQLVTAPHLITAPELIVAPDLVGADGARDLITVHVGAARQCTAAEFCDVNRSMIVREWTATGIRRAVQTDVLRTILSIVDSDEESVVFGEPIGWAGLLAGNHQDGCVGRLADGTGRLARGF
jgi:hypothetical protein